jgi:hypothetical protein
LLAGGLHDLSQRATVYHHLYQHSDGNHIFPLIAAHGALWAGRYFRFGMQLGQICSWQYPFSSFRRQEQMEQLSAFADAFRDINRCVCIETYTSYHFTERYGHHPLADRIIEPTVLHALNRCHEARRSGQQLSTENKRYVFQLFFLNEQQQIVGPAIKRAMNEFHWPAMKFLAVRPVIRFSFFGTRAMFFRSFADSNERIAKGLRAFDRGAKAGWETVEKTLGDYRILPAGYLDAATDEFDRVRHAALASA